ncbi:MAG TPA: HD domain-containing protein [Pseudonocardiaceae bacterium]|nr:HD domain-containing protein [Pseudonocardiaceae bacterium]
MDAGERAREVAAKLLQTSLPRRWAHVQGVVARAQKVTFLPGVEAQLLVDAATLHDIGYAPEISTTGFHPLDGARYVAALGAPVRVVNLIAHHSCATFEAGLRALSAELAEFEDEGPTALRDALWWADMTTDPDGGVITVVDRVAEIQDRYGPDDLVSCFIRLAWPELEAAVRRTEERLAAVGIDYEK